jgi:hypothetical protein
MPVHLLPCPGCTRHVRASETECPFCLTALEFGDTAAPRAPATRLGRAATFAFGAAVATTMQVAGCSGGTSPGDVDSGSGTDSGGGAEVDAGSDPGDSGGGSETDSGTATPDSGMEQDSGGGVTPLYGGPPLRDAGRDQDDSGGGGPVPLYGAPPSP